MRYAAGPWRGHVDLAGVALSKGDKFRNGMRWNRRMHQQDKRRAADASHRGDVPDEIETEFFIKRGVDCRARCDQEKGVAVRGGLHNLFCCDVAPSAGPVFDDECLS